MQDTENNQEDSNRQDYAQPAGEDEHETHTTALVLLVLVTIVVIAVIFSVNREANNLNPDTYDDEITQPENEIPDETHGAGIPVEQVETTDIADLTGLPDNIPIPEDKQVTSNYTSPMGERTQRVYQFDTSTSQSDMANSFQQWLETSNFSLDTVDENQNNTTITASQNQQKMIISISSNEGTRSVQINHMTQPE